MECARRLKRLLKSLRSSAGKAVQPAAEDPVTHLILGVFSRDMPENKAREVLERMRAFVVDYNELRVTSPREMAEYIGDYPDGWTKCEDLSRALNRVFAMQHLVTLDHLLGKSRKEARDYLAKLEGLDAYSRARVLLFGLQQHAIPLDEAMWACLRKLHIVDPKASLEEAQAFLERHIDEEDAIEFVTLLRKHAWAECGAAVRSGQAEKIHSIPPKRASKNMLRPITSSGEFEIDEVEAPVEDKKAPAARKRVVSGSSTGGKLAASRNKPAESRRVRSAGRKKAKSA